MADRRRHLPKVFLLVETSRGYSRDILRGILQYETRYGPWDIDAAPGGRREQHLPEIHHSGKKGIIAHIVTRLQAREIAKADIPTVSVFPTSDIPDISGKLRHFGEVRLDSPAIGRMAAEYLLEKRLVHFAFVGEVYDADWSVMRRDAFSSRISEAGFQTHCYPTPRRSEIDWNIERKAMTKWLKSLPKPIGLLAACDVRGRRVIDACKQSRIQVPDEVAVVGVDNDELFCDTTSPKLSSVSLDTVRAGFEAAAMLDQLMNGKREKRSATFGPVRVIPRLSSDIIPVEDELVRQTFLYIRDFYVKPISVPDIAGALGVSRRLLEIRFRKAVGISILSEIKKQRLERAKRLLLETDLALDQIASLSGFQSKYYLAGVFRKKLGMTTGQFRNLFGR